MAGFEFVNITNPKQAREHSTRVRRHVMKDIGKARRKPKPKLSRTSKPQHEADAVDRQCVSSSEPKRRNISVSIGKERDMGSFVARAMCSPRSEGWLSHMVYPIEMSEDKLGLVRFMVEEARYVYRPFRFAWLFMSLTDPAAWHISLANAAAWRAGDFGSMKKDFKSSPVAMSHYTLSLESISKRLQSVDIDEKSDLDGLIMAVTGCLCHDSTLGNFDRMTVHLKGLKRLVDQRGGQDELYTPMLQLAISWLELVAATFHDTRPYFVPPKVSYLHVDDRSEDTRYLYGLLKSWDVQCPFLGDILGAITATAKVAIYINQHAHKPDLWEDDITMARLLSPALHEILTLEGRALPNDPLDSQYSGVAAREAFRRAALIFLADVKIRSRHSALELPKHLDAFRQISRLPLVDWSVIPELNMWAHVVAAIQEDDGQDRQWHIVVIAGIMDSMGVQTAAEALDIVRGIIWVESMMGDKAKTLQEEIDAHLIAAKPSK